MNPVPPKRIALMLESIGTRRSRLFQQLAEELAGGTPCCVRQADNG
jgi:hypothetical protein